MRSVILGFVVTVGIAAAANATPLAPSSTAQQNGNIVTVAGGCGPGLHPTPWGRCAPFHHRFYGYYGPHHYGWSDDGAAESLNRQELSRIYGY